MSRRGPSIVRRLLLAASGGGSSFDQLSHARVDNEPLPLGGGGGGGGGRAGR